MTTPIKYLSLLLLLAIVAFIGVCTPLLMHRFDSDSRTLLLIAGTAVSLPISPFVFGSVTHVRPRVPELILVILLLAASVPIFLPESATRSVSDLGASPFTVANLTRSTLIGVAGVFAAVQATRLKVVDAPLLALAGFGTLAVTSAIYSSYPLASLSHSLPYAITILSFAAFVSESQRDPTLPSRLWITLVLYFGVVLTLMWVGSLVSPNEGFANRGSLPVPGAAWPRVHHTLAGFMGAVLAVAAVIELDRRGLTRPLPTVVLLSLLMLGATTAVFAQARASLLALGLGLALLSARHPRGRVLGAVLLPTTTAGLIAFAPTLTAYVLRGQSLSEFQSLTGRVHLWDAAISFGKEALITGHGYYTGIRLDLTERISHWSFYTNVSTADNSFIQAFVDLGIIGLSVLLIALAIAFHRAIRPSQSLPRSGTLALMLLIVVRSLSGPGIEVFGFVLIVFIVLMTYAKPSGAGDDRRDRGRPRPMHLQRPIVPFDDLAHPPRP